MKKSETLSPDYDRVLALFMSHVHMIPEVGCWLFVSSENGNGYTKFWDRGKTYRAHRWSYERFVGPIPEGLSICHRCDVPCCVNPNHLFAATHQENIDDKMRKGRQIKGEEHSSSKLTETDIRSIRSVGPYYHGQYTDMSRMYGVNISLIRRIMQRKVWKHVN